MVAKTDEIDIYPGVHHVSYSDVKEYVSLAAVAYMPWVNIFNPGVFLAAT